LQVDEAGNADARAKKLPCRLVLAGQALNRIAHFSDDMVAAESEFGA